MDQWDETSHGFYLVFNLSTIIIPIFSCISHAIMVSSHIAISFAIISKNYFHYQAKIFYMQLDASKFVLLMYTVLTRNKVILTGTSHVSVNMRLISM